MIIGFILIAISSLWALHFFVMLPLPQYVETTVVPRAEILKTEVEWLHSIKTDFVVINFFFSYNLSAHR